MTAELKRLLAFERYRNLAILQTLQEIKMTHTPGPWWNDHGIIRAGRNAFENPHSKIAPCTIAQLSSEANATLIAAAPDMLAALKYLVEQNTDGQGDYTMQAIMQARAAIAKAEGRQ